MDLTIVALYTICDDLLISTGHHDHAQAKMSDAEVMTTALVAVFRCIRQYSRDRGSPCAGTLVKTQGM